MSGIVVLPHVSAAQWTTPEMKQGSSSEPRVLHHPGHLPGFLFAQWTERRPRRTAAVSHLIQRSLHAHRAVREA